MRIGIDVGGTFTDVVFIDKNTGQFQYTKTPTTHHDLAEGVLTGLAEILEMTGHDIGAIDYVIHGTTIGTNAIVEGKGAKVGLITTAGFEDVLEIGRVARPQGATYDFEVDNPPPLVPRYLRKGVRERVNAQGAVSLALDESSLKGVVSFFRDEGVEAVAVSLLFAFLNDTHEEQVARVCHDLLPSVEVSISSQVCPEFREYERTCTTVMNAYLGPVITQYFNQLQRELEDRYGTVRLYIMQSNGGSMTVNEAKKNAAHLINSGPAGGAIATAFVGKLTDNPMAIGADMGGTTFDISVVHGGMPKTTTWGGVTDYPIKLPMVDLKTIGAGGGSIAWVDEERVLNVGPQSSGSAPGPACYGWGGTLPTVSDANCALGRLNPRYFLGGKLPLYPEKARQAIAEHVARPMGLTVEEAALGIVRIANANMVKGISGISVEKGYDLREFALIGLGGAVGLHIVDIGHELTVARVILPPMSGNLSALGLAVSDIQHDYVKTLARGQKRAAPDHLTRCFEELEQRAWAQLEAEGIAEERTHIAWSLDMRYEGQSWELNTPVDRKLPLGDTDVRTMIDVFHALHQQTYSYCDPAATVEIVNVRVRAVGKNDTLTLPEYGLAPTPPEQALNEHRRVCLASGGGYDEIPAYERDRMGVGTHVDGPCIIEERISTTLIPAGYEATVDRFRNVVVERQCARRTP